MTCHLTTTAIIPLLTAGLHVFVKGFCPRDFSPNNCDGQYSIEFTAPPANSQVSPTETIRFAVNITATSSPQCRLCDGYTVVFQFDTNVTVVAVSNPVRLSTSPPESHAAAGGVRAQATQVTAYLINQANGNDGSGYEAGEAWVDVILSPPTPSRARRAGGIINTSVLSVGNALAAANGISVNTAVPLVATQLLLTPYKAYRHLGQHAAISVTALDAANTPVPGLLVTFLAYGDCKPSLEHSSATTNAQGQATMYISAREPGAVAVVAAAVTTNGVALQSNAAHIIFYDHEEYAEHRGREYYRGGRR